MSKTGGYSASKATAKKIVAYQQELLEGTIDASLPIEEIRRQEIVQVTALEINLIKLWPEAEDAGIKTVVALAKAIIEVKRFKADLMGLKAPDKLQVDVKYPEVTLSLPRVESAE